MPSHSLRCGVHADDPVDALGQQLSHHENAERTSGPARDPTADLAKVQGEKELDGLACPERGPRRG
jgi:hypothetical protein